MVCGGSYIPLLIPKETSTLLIPKETSTDTLWWLEAMRAVSARDSSSVWPARLSLPTKYGGIVIPPAPLPLPSPLPLFFWFLGTHRNIYVNTFNWAAFTFPRVFLGGPAAVASCGRYIAWCDDAIDV